jgi:hypothetical protein
MTGMGHLSDDELHDVLARAEEIERANRRGAAWNAELQAVIGAGEAVGLSRPAIERALAERFPLAGSPPTAGSLVWARSADGKFYVAEVTTIAEHSAAVRFLNGSEVELGLDALRPCAFVPGERVACNWPMWGPWTCTVVSYDATKRRVKLSDGWGSTRQFPIGDVWLAPPANPKVARARVKWLAAGATIGAVVGSILTALLL